MHVLKTLKGFAIGAALAACVGAQAQSAPSFESVLEAAKKEGTLIVGLSSPGTAATHAALFEAFNKRFNISVRGQWRPSPGPATNVKVMAEAAAGQKASFDIVGLGSPEDIPPMRDRGVLKPYPWEAVFGSQLPGIKAAMERTMPALRGLSFNYIDAVFGIAWNPQLIKDSEVPNTVDELADPKWRGKFALNIAFLNPLSSMAYVRGQDETMGILKRLLDNRPLLERGTPQVTRAISAGQVPLGITTFHTALRATQNGEPVRFKVLSDYVFVFEGMAYVPENAPNPNAARLFAAWLVTEGMSIAGRLEPVPNMSDPGSDLGKLVRETMARTGSKIAAAKSPEDIARHEPLRQAISKLIAEQK